MRELRVLIADDELLARKRMVRLASALPGVTVLAAVEDGAAVLAAVDEEPLDLLLLDIQMPGLTGLDASALLPAGGPAVIFTTAHREHALEAFGVGALDYLLKPVDAARLSAAVERVRERLAAPAEAPERLALRTRKGVRLIAPSALRCATFDGTALTVHTTSDERWFVDGSLSELEAQLPDPPFVRVHRRVLVNLDEVELLEPLDTGGYFAHLRGTDDRVEVSRKVARELRRRLGVR